MNAQVTDPATDSSNRRVGGATLLIAVGLPVAAILTAGMRQVEVQPGLIDWLFVAAVALVTIATFGVLVPRVQLRPPARAVRTALVMTVLALVLTPFAFWTMVPLILGSAGAWIAHTVTADRGRTRLASAAIMLGVLAGVLSVAGYIATS